MYTYELVEGLSFNQRNRVIDAFVERMPGDAAWKLFASELVIALINEASPNVEVQGYSPKPKRRMDIVAQFEVARVLRGMAANWPLAPLGRTPGSVDNAFREALEAVQ